MSGDRFGASLQLPFFVYGTLRPGGRHHDWALADHLTARQLAAVAGVRLYPGPGFPYAVEVPDLPSALVYGHLLYAPNSVYAEVLRTLDRLEGYAVGARDNHYERVRATARRSDGSAATCWLYVAAHPLAQRLRRSSTPLYGGEWSPESGTGPAPIT